jgi:hypothetical protein
MAALQLEDPDAALGHLRAAVRLGQRAGSAELTADARSGLAFALHVRGHGRRALREVEAALADLTGVARARAQAQRGAILSESGRVDEALPDFAAALTVLRRAGDHVWVQRVLYNRAVAYGYRQEFTAAQNDLRVGPGRPCRLGCWPARRPCPEAGTRGPALSSRRPSGTGATGLRYNEPRPGTPRRSSAGRRVTSAARPARPAPRCGCSTSTGPGSAPPTCGRTRPGTGPTWPRSGCGWRSPAAGPPPCWSGPSRAGPAT